MTHAPILLWSILYQCTGVHQFQFLINQIFVLMFLYNLPWRVISCHHRNPLLLPYPLLGLAFLCCLDPIVSSSIFLFSWFWYTTRPLNFCFLIFLIISIPLIFCNISWFILMLYSVWVTFTGPNIVLKIYLSDIFRCFFTVFVLFVLCLRFAQLRFLPYDVFNTAHQLFLSYFWTRFYKPYLAM